MPSHIRDYGLCNPSELKAIIHAIIAFLFETYDFEENCVSGEQTCEAQAPTCSRPTLGASIANVVKHHAQLSQNQIFSI